jgi:multidrug efflux pump
MVLVTGMVIGTLFTLVVVPVFYGLIAAERATVPAVAHAGQRTLPLTGIEELAHA